MANNIPTLFDKSLQAMNISDKQKAVLRASLTLFSEKGVESTSTSDIAKMANVAEGTVYKQFKTKKAPVQGAFYLCNLLLFSFVPHEQVGRNDPCGKQNDADA